MAKIVDPDDLTKDLEITITPGTSGTLRVNYAGVIVPADGITGQCVYSYLKEEWRTDSDLIKYPFPMIAITEEQFELTNDWNWEDRRTARTIRDAGWALKNSGGISKQEWANITTLGSFNAASDTAYYVNEATGLGLIPTSGATPSGFRFPDAVNEAVQIYAVTDHALGPQPHGIGGSGYDRRDTMITYLREEQKTYGIYDLLTEQGLSTITYKKYALPLANASDAAKVDIDDSGIEADDASYRHITVVYYPEAPYVKTIGAGTYNFSIVINGDGQSAEEIYEKVQYLLRQPFNINGWRVPDYQVTGYGHALETSGSEPYVAGAENEYYVRGDLAGSLLTFVGDTLQTNFIAGWGGTYIENFNADDINRLKFADDTNPSTLQEYPFTATGNLLLSDTLVDDTNANYWMFFTSIGASAYGTSDAILVQDSDSQNISGAADSSSIAYTFDYDENEQPYYTDGGGQNTVPHPNGRTKATNAAVTVVAIGLDTAQFVKTTGLITRSTGNNISLVAALERNYSNPA